MANEKFKVKFGLAVGDTSATIDATTGDIVTAGDVEVGGNTIKKSGGTPVIEFSGTNLTTLAGDLTVSGNSIRGVTGVDAIEIAGADVVIAGDLTVSGNDIKSSTGTPITMSGDDVNIQGQLRVTGDVIRKSGGNSVLTFSGTNLVTTSGDLTVAGNTINSSTGAALELNGSDVTVPGDLQVDGGDLVTNAATFNLLTSNATTVNFASAATSVSIGANTGTTTINNSLVADDISILTVDATNIEVSNIKAKDGTAAMTIADTTGIVTVSTELNVDNINISGNTISSTNTNGAINLTPNGTGTVVIPTADVTNLDVTNIRALDGTAAATIANTTGIITVSTELNVDNINISGNTIISTDTNGNITINPNGTGDLITNRNIVRGAIRNATTDTNGFIWYLNTSSLTAPYSGISVDNSPSTASQSALVVRNYTGNNTAASIGSRGRLVFEKARNTVASPVAVAVGDLLGEVAATGYTSTGWINDQYSAVPAFFGFTAAENWVANTNLGSSFNLTLAPTATTVTSNANLITCLGLNPQAGSIRTDGFVISRGKTSAFTATGCSISGTTLTIGTVTSGAVQVGQTLMLTSAGIAINTLSYIVSGSGSTWTLSAASGTLTGASITGYNGYIGTPSTANSVDILQDLRLITNNIENNTGVTQVQLSASNTLRLVGDSMTMETVSGTDMLVLAPVNTVISSDTVSLKDSAGAALVGNKIDYSRVYGQWQNLNTITPAAANTAYAFALPTIDYANVASVASTSRIIPGALGFYKMQFSVQVLNTDNASEHTAYFWWRKNGVDVPGSMGRLTVPRGAVGGELIAGWDNMVEVTTITDYWELMYAVEDVALTFPFYAATAFGPSTASLFVTIVPIGA